MLTFLSHRFVRIVLGIFLFSGVAVFAGLYSYAGSYGLNVVLRRGGSIWQVIKPDDTRISPPMRLALQENPPIGRAGIFEWKEIAPGFDAAELPVIVANEEVDRILLARIDPAKFQFQLHNAAAGSKDLQDWMKELGAILVINGSYFSRYGTPDVPFLSDRARSGPAEYDAKHGAFVVSDSFVGIRDLQNEKWQTAFEGAQYATVSYPMLVRGEESNVKADHRWLANRSFVAQDRLGRIILGTTKDAFFSLDRLGAFLKQSPLELALALNLDGGPVACQGISLNGFERNFCGQWETAIRDDNLKLLRPLIGNRRWALPMVLAVVPK